MNMNLSYILQKVLAYKELINLLPNSFIMLLGQTHKTFLAQIYSH
jgi:hypothetical protein